MASVRFEHVSISYGPKQIIKDLNLSIEDSEIMGIIGPSGCGKTTVIRALCGFIKPTRAIFISVISWYSARISVSTFPPRGAV